MSEIIMSDPYQMPEPNMSEQIFLDMGFASQTVTEAFLRFPGRQDLISDYLINSENVGQIPKKIKMDTADTRAVTYYGSKVRYNGLSGSIDGFDQTHSVVRFNPGVSNRKWIHVSDSNLEWIVIHHNSIPITTANVMTWRRQVGTVKIPLIAFENALGEYKSANGPLSTESDYSLTESDIEKIWLEYGFRSNSHNALWRTMNEFASRHVHTPSGIAPKFTLEGQHKLRLELMSYFITLCDFYVIPTQLFNQILYTCTTEFDFVNRVIPLFPSDFDPNKSIAVHNQNTFSKMFKIWLNPEVYISAEIQSWVSKSIPLVEFEASTAIEERIVFNVFFSDMTFVRPTNQDQPLLRGHFQTLFRRMFVDAGPPAPQPTSNNASFWFKTLEMSKKNHQEKSKPSAAFISQLLPFQQKAFSWMRMREESATPPSSMGWKRHQLKDGFAFYTDMFGSLSYTRQGDGVRGGILAQDYGMGKTVEMLALIASSESTKPTLIVMPPRSLDIWVKEASKHTPSLKILKYHGASRTLDDILAQNIVLSTFRILKEDKIGRKNSKTLQNVDWGRIVVDDFHKLPAEPLNGSPLQSLNADIKWCLSAKGVRNIKGVGTLFRFFNVTPFNTIETNNSAFNKANGPVIREMLVEMTFAHSTKDVSDELPKPVEDVSLYQENKYSQAQQHLITAIRKYIAKQNSQMRHLHVWLLRRWMVQAAVHPNLIPLRAFAEEESEAAEHLTALTTIGNFVDSLGNSSRKSTLRGLVEACKAGQEKCTICMGNMERPTLTSCYHVFCYDCIQSCYSHDPRQRKCPLCRESGVGTTLLELSDRNSEVIEDLFYRFVYQTSTFKIDQQVYDEIVLERNKVYCSKMVYLLEHVAARDGKTVVYIQNHRVREYVIQQLRRSRVRFEYIHPPQWTTAPYTGQIHCAMAKFQEDERVRVFVMNPVSFQEHRIVLTKADNIIFFDTLTTGVCREKALQRVIRIGQKRPIKVLTLKTQNSIDTEQFQNFFPSVYSTNS